MVKLIKWIGVSANVMVPEKIISFRMKRESGENPEQYPLL